MMPMIELPALLPNEHILGVLARWFDTTGRNDFLVTTRKVTSNNNLLTPASAWRPAYSDLAQHYIDTIGISKLLEEHTLVPFYRPFLSANDYQQLTGHDCQQLAELRILPRFQNNIKAASCWRWCSECSKEDYDTYGVTYWHTYHQIPTMLKCYKHNLPLLSQCQSCGFQFKNFQRHWLPPLEDNCPECESCFEGKAESMEPVSNWLDAMSISFQNTKNPIQQNSLLELIREKLGHQALPRNISVALREEVAQMQLDFESWLKNEVLATYYCKERHEMLKHGNKVLNIVTTAYRDSTVPPISLMLMLKSLSLENELTLKLLE